MSITSDLLKKKLKKLKELFPEMDEERIKRELIPLGDEEIRIMLKKKKKD